MKWICFFAGWMLSAGLSAQSILSGNVSDSSQVLEGATVTLQGPTRNTTLTNTNGNFTFRNLPDGTYDLTISYAGFESASQTVVVPRSTSVDIRLNPLSKALLPVEVSAVRANDRAPFAKTNISKKQIEKFNLGQDIPYLLNQTPNVVINSDAGNGVGYTALRIRGTDASRINMTINGIPYNDAESQGTFFVDLPDFLSSATSIQIQRGVGTSSNGAGAFGASMNFSTHEYNPKGYAELNNSYGSFDTWKNTIKFGSGLIGKHFTIDARLSSIRSDGYVDRASSNLQGGYFNAAYWGKNSSLKLNVILGKEKTYQSWYGVSAGDLKSDRTVNYAGTEKPGEPYKDQTDNYWQNHYQLIWNKSFNSNLLFNTAFYLSTGRGYYEEYRGDRDLADYGLPPVINATDTTYTSDLIRRLWLKNKLWGQVISLQFQKAKNTITVGGGWSYYPGRHYGDVTWTAAKPDLTNRWYDLDATKADINIYAKWQYQLSNAWSLFTDVQYRYAHYKIDGFRDNPGVRINEQWNFVNPKAGISYLNKNWSGFFSYAVANKEPNRDDFEAGINELPKREQLHDFELNITRKNVLPNWNLGATFYYMYYRDQLVLTGKINDVGAYTRTNIPSSYRAGVELETQYQFAKGSISYNLGLSSNKIKDFTEYVDDYDNGGQIMIEHHNTNISYSPSIVQQGTIAYRPLKNFELGWLSKHVGRQYLDNTSQEARSLDPYFVNDVRASCNTSIGKVFKDITFIFQLNNLFDVKYEPNGYTFSYLAGGSVSTENYYFPMAGRNFMAAINIRF